MARYYDRRTNRLYNCAQWRKLSKSFLAENPYCVYCEKEGKATPSQVTDHIKPHNEDLDLFWDYNNLQPLCKKCHDTDKAREESIGFTHKIGIDGWPVDPKHPANRHK